ncbi:c-type cytochrome [Janthinobacterium aquaticum]|uniref:c-type cytochrome n=1 Tax=Janthinobacterium sp. FT58W TaxID=2654254 RepID=UPI001D026FDC|nr:c-type cytochrome [Janthinobacterium sp. FT58W]
MKMTLLKKLKIAGALGLAGAGVVATIAGTQALAADPDNHAPGKAVAGDALVGAPAGKDAGAPPDTTPGLVPRNAQEAAIERGRYVAVAGDCIACHTAHGSGKPFAGGLVLETPFGKLVGSNITQDVKTGIGSWTQEEFTRAVRQGKGKHGENLYSAMPYNAYAKVSDADMRDLWAYMKTIKPVENTVVANQLPFPFNIRLLMVGWNWLFFDNSPFKPDATRSVEWNRGAYLVQGLAHCASCHTAKNLFGADKSETLAGGTLGGWYAPNITGSRGGLHDWSVEQTVEYLQTGGNRISMASGPMAEAVENSTQHMSSADLRAIAVYLKSVAGPAMPARPAPLPADNAQMLLGARVYEVNCAACHGSDGKGLDGLVTSLGGNSALQAGVASNLINAVLRGTTPAITHGKPTGAGMPGFAWKLSDAEVAAVGSFVRNSWGNAAPAVSAASVAEARKSINAPAKLKFANAAR